MGNNTCCESQNNLNKKNQDKPENKHHETVPQENYQPQQRQTESQIKQTHIKTLEEKITPTPNPEEQLIEEPIAPQNKGPTSLGSSVKNSDNTGERISQVSSLKNKKSKGAQFSKAKINKFQMVKSINAHDKIIVCMIELSNKLIATGSYDNTIKIWNISNEYMEKEIPEEGKVFSLLEFEENVILSAIDKTPDDIQEISQIKQKDIVIHCFDLKNSSVKSVFELTGHQLRVNCLVKCDDKFFASCSNDCNIIIWDYHFRKEANILQGHHDCVLCMIRLNDGRLCSGGADMLIKIWDWEKGDCVANLNGNTHYVKCLCQLSNGYIISGSHDNLIKIWDDTYQPLDDLIGHTRSVRSICQIGTTNYIASGSFDHTIKIWNLDTNKCVQTLTEHGSSIINVIFHSDGYLVSCSNDKTIKVWK